ncbi:site-specific integrase [Pollutibacter soli]|uniref:site-specific integrase n=1 Tax=Pollutibacter soli TaxID=3034157 RepID=UPI0030136427
MITTLGMSVKPENWDSKKSYVKNNGETRRNNEFNAFCIKRGGIDRIVTEEFNTAQFKGLPVNLTSIKERIRQNFSGNSQKEKEKKPEADTLYSVIERLISQDIKMKGQDRSVNTVRTYKTTLGHLKAFAAAKKYPINFESINLDFYHKFTKYLEGQGLNKNSIGKNIKNVKTFMNKSFNLGLTKNQEHKKEDFHVFNEPADSIYLTESDIEKLYKFDFSNNKRLEQVRDLFVFGCYVGMRFSDFSEIKKENVFKHKGRDFLQVRTQKTGELVTVPCHKIVLEIFKKYERNPNRLPKSVSNQKFNDYIKEACRLAGLTDKGRVENSPEIELWEKVSSHTARRSFATNTYLKGVSSYTIMRITGHKTEKSFLRYIKFTSLDAAESLLEAWEPVNKLKAV